MEIISWNTRGASRICFYSHISNLLFKYNLDIPVPMETRVNFFRAHKILKKSNCQILKKSLLKVSVKVAPLKNNIDIQIKTHNRFINYQMRDNKGC